MKAEGDGHFTLTTAALRFDFDTNAGRFSIGRPAATDSIRAAFALARLNSRAISTVSRRMRVRAVTHQNIEDVHGLGARLHVDFLPEAGVSLALLATLYDRYPFLSLRLIATNQSAETMHLRQLTPLRAAPQDGSEIQFRDRPAPLSFFKNGYQSWSYSGLRRAHQRDIDTRLGRFTRLFHFNPTTPISRRRGVFNGEMFGALIDHEAQQAVIAGQIGAANQFAQVGADTRRGQAALSVTCDLDGVPLAPEQSIASEEVFVQLIDLPAVDPFAEYVGAVARQMQPRPSAPLGAGWCSWYSYFPNIREEDVIANLKTAGDWRRIIPIDWIQIDDGYQVKTGDWLSINDKFPQGMRWLAGQIHESGYTPGLWLAPFIAVRSSQLASRHADWLIHDERGHPAQTGKAWNEETCGLDTTHPGAQEYIRRVVETAVREWGYSFLKLDFLCAAAAPGRRTDPTLTRAQALRRGLALIREVAGDDVFLLGCGCPLGPAIGLVDGMRIGPDIAPEPEPTWIPRYKGITLIFKHEAGFPAGRNAARNVLNRSSLHRRWWLNDPDCVIVREARHMSEIEVRSWASLVGLSGGLIALGDDLPSLPLQRRRYIASLVPLLGDSALPLDLLEREMPELYALRQDRAWGSGVVAGVFNWEDRPRRKLIDLAQLGLDPFQPHHAFSFWAGEYRRVEDGQIDFGVLPAHGCAVVALRPILDRPHLIATTFHLTMGGEVRRFDIGDRRLVIGVELKRRATGEMWLAGYSQLHARVNHQPIAATRRAEPDIWAVSLEVDGAAEIEIVGDLSTKQIL